MYSIAVQEGKSETRKVSESKLNANKKRLFIIVGSVGAFLAAIIIGGVLFGALQKPEQLQKPNQRLATVGQGSVHTGSLRTTAGLKPAFSMAYVGHVVKTRWPVVFAVTAFLLVGVALAIVLPSVLAEEPSPLVIDIPKDHQKEGEETDSEQFVETPVGIGALVFGAIVFIGLTGLAVWKCWHRTNSADTNMTAPAKPLTSSPAMATAASATTIAATAPASATTATIPPSPVSTVVVPSVTLTVEQAYNTWVKFAEVDQDCKAVDKEWNVTVDIYWEGEVVYLKCKSNSPTLKSVWAAVNRTNFGTENFIVLKYNKGRGTLEDFKAMEISVWPLESVINAIDEMKVKSIDDKSITLDKVYEMWKEFAENDSECETVKSQSAGNVTVKSGFFSPLYLKCTSDFPNTKSVWAELNRTHLEHMDCIRFIIEQSRGKKKQFWVTKVGRNIPDAFTVLIKRMYDNGKNFASLKSRIGSPATDDVSSHSMKAELVKLIDDKATTLDEAYEMWIEFAEGDTECEKVVSESAGNVKVDLYLGPGNVYLKCKSVTPTVKSVWAELNRIDAFEEEIEFLIVTSSSTGLFHAETVNDVAPARVKALIKGMCDRS